MGLRPHSGHHFGKGGEQIEDHANRLDAPAQLPLAGDLERFDAAEPTRLLAVVDLPEVQEVPIDHAPVGAAALLRDAPVPMLLAVLDPAMALEVHGAPRVLHSSGPCKGG